MYDKVIRKWVKKKKTRKEKSGKGKKKKKNMSKEKEGKPQILKKVNHIRGERG